MICAEPGCGKVLCGTVRAGTTGLCRRHAQMRVQAKRQAALYASPEWQGRVAACASCGKELPRKAWRKGNKCRVCTLKSDERRALMQRISTDHYADPANRERARQRMLAASEERLRAMLPWCPPDYRPLYRLLTRTKGMLAADARAVVEQAMADDAKAAERAGCPLLLFAKVREARRWLKEGQEA